MNLEEYYHTFYSESLSKFTLKNINQNEKAVFLDRDGILIEDVNHISSVEQIKLCKNVKEFLKKARDNNYSIIVVTNQSSISRKIISYLEYIKITEKFLSFLKTDILPDLILTSFHLPNNKSNLKNFNWRKPGTGMFEYAFEKYNFDPNKSIMVGDKLTDLIPANNCRISKLIYIKSGIHFNEINKVIEWNMNKTNKIKILNELDLFNVI